MFTLRLAAASLALLAAAASAPAYPTEATLLAEIDQLRADPAGYAAELRRVAAGYRGGFYRAGDGSEHVSREGAAAVVEAADALTRQAPLPSLAGDPTLRAAARDQVAAQAPTGAVGHASAAGATPGERVRRRGGDIYVGEVIAYGVHTPVDVVRSLIVDDGVPARGHRRLLLSAAYRVAGAWCGPHAVWGMMCVIDLAATPGGRPHVPGK